jgi:hypothetical protein
VTPRVSRGVTAHALPRLPDTVSAGGGCTSTCWPDQRTTAATYRLPSWRRMMSRSAGSPLAALKAAISRSVTTDTKGLSAVCPFTA